MLEYGDGWFPLHGRGEAPIGERVAELNRLAQERGREPIPVTMFSAPSQHQAVDEFIEAGVSRCVFAVPSSGAEQVLPLLDRLTAMVESFEG